MKRLAVVVILAACAGAYVAPAPAGAYVAAGPAWPGGTVTYRSATPAYTSSIDRAARLLNGAGVGVRLRRVTSNPDVVFTYRGSACTGAAFIGYQRRASDTVLLGRGCSAGLITLTAVHELSHVLGLGHETRWCSRMNVSFDSSGTPSKCSRHSLSYWLAHPLRPDDRRGLRALYGG